MGWYGGFAPYVRVADRKKKAASKIQALKKQGKKVEPVVIEGRTIARTFWGKAWCEHLESFSDYENRLPRGRTYVRNGSVIDLNIEPGKIQAMVSGSSIYQVSISITSLVVDKWRGLLKECSGKIDSLVELLQGRFERSVMEKMVDVNKGLFPKLKDIQLRCSCPDWADMCKHVAAVLYGVGARLDEKPELLFKLRQVDHLELLSSVGARAGIVVPKLTQSGLSEDNLSSIFGIDIKESENKTEIAINTKVNSKKVNSTADGKPKSKSVAKAGTRAKAKPKLKTAVRTVIKPKSTTNEKLGVRTVKKVKASPKSKVVSKLKPVSTTKIKGKPKTTIQRKSKAVVTKRLSSNTKVVGTKVKSAIKKLPKSTVKIKNTRDVKSNSRVKKK